MKTRYMGLDLGTKTLGIAISDRTNTIITPYKVIRFKSEEYETAFQELKEIIAKEGITEIAIGLPKNMDGGKIQIVLSSPYKNTLVRVNKITISNRDIVILNFLFHL